MAPARTILAVTCVIIAYLYSSWKEKASDSGNLSKESVRSISKAWDELISSTVPSYSRVTVGLNACVDLIANAIEVLAIANAEPTSQSKDHTVLRDFTDLAESFSHFFAQGCAAERSFSNPHLFEKLTNAANLTGSQQYYIGGNAALMAQKIVSEFPAVKVQLVGPIGPQLLLLLNRQIIVPDASIVAEDEVHLIMEYQVNDTWAGHVTPVANRFITSHDKRNSRAEMSDAFFNAVADFESDLVILSGLHMLESQGAADWTGKLSDIEAKLAAIPIIRPLHLELASMVDKVFLNDLSSKIFCRVNSLGLNEQELGFLTRSLGSGVDLGSERHPTIAGVVEALRWLLTYFGQDHAHESRLTRVHFHCLTFHVIATSRRVWSNTAAAVAAGARVATTQACDSDKIEHSNVSLQIPLLLQFSHDGKSAAASFDYSKPVTHWHDGGIEFAFSPVLVCKRPLKTVGLGDAISATGLLYSSYNAASASP